MIKYIRKITLFCLFLFSFEAIAQDLKSKLDTNSLNIRIPQMMDSAGVPALSVGVIQKGKLVWSKNFGIKSLQTKEKVAPNSLFEAASLTKPMFSYVVMQMVNEGKIALDTPLVRYVSEKTIEAEFLFYKINDPRFRKITARMCLSHSTGFPNGRNYYGLPLAFEPATDMSYSGEGIGYLQLIIEKLANTRIDLLMQRYIFEPLDMKNSHMVWADSLAPRMCFAHGSQGYTVYYNRNFKPYGSYTLVTNGEDYGKFLASMLNQEGLRKDLYTEMWQPQSTAKTGYLASLSWGLGVGVYDSKAGRAFWHWGDLGTSKAYMMGFPDEQAGVVFFGNSANTLNMALQLLAETVGGEHKQFNVLNIAQYNDPIILLGKYFNSQNFDAFLQKLNGYVLSKESRFNNTILNNIGYNLMKMNKNKEALEVFKINFLIYPDMANVYDSLGEAFLKNNNKVAAKQYYLMALEKNPNNQNAKNKLKTL